MMPQGINGSMQLFNDPTLINCTMEQWEKWVCKGVCANAYGFVSCNGWLWLGTILFIIIIIVTGYLMTEAYDLGYNNGRKRKK